MNRINIRDEQAELLLKNLKNSLLELQELLDNCNSHWTYEDGIYRFYHHSFKVYYLQGLTQKVVDTLQNLLPGCELNKDFMRIVNEGTNKTFEHEHNRRWHEETRPIMEAFFHAKFFLEMAIKYGNELNELPSMLPSGWAAFLYLYNLR